MKHTLITTLCLSIFIVYASSSSLHASDLIYLNGTYYQTNGNYNVEQDENGVFLQTDQGASWYLSGDELTVFNPGDNGRYYFEKDASKLYILTDKKRVFYFKQEISGNLEKERSQANADSEPIDVNNADSEPIDVNDEYNYENYKKILNTWIGAHSDELITKWGSPHSSYPLSDGGQILEYVEQRQLSSFSTKIGGYHIQLPTKTLHCKTIFQVNSKGIIVKYRAKGNDCKSWPPKK